MSSKFCTELPDELREAALKRGEKPDIYHERVSRLRSLVKDDDTITGRSETEYLTRFLRAKRYKVHAAHYQMRHYYRCRKDLYGNEPLGKIAGWPFESNSVMILDGLDNEQRPVLYLNTETWVPKEVKTFEDVFKCMFLACDYISRNPYAQINGFTIMLDFTNFGLRQASYLPRDIVRYLKRFNDSIPVILRRSHVINEPTSFSLIYSAIKHFIEPAVRDGIVRHTDNSTLLEYFPKKMLPEKYGGTFKLEEGSGSAMLNKILHDKDPSGISLANDYKEYGTIQSKK